MITNEQAQIDALASDASYNRAGPMSQLQSLGYQRVDLSPSISLDDPTTGFHAEIYQKTGTSEYIVAFTGTQDGQDWAANTALGTAQWRNNKDNVFAALNALQPGARELQAGNASRAAG